MCCFILQIFGLYSNCIHFITLRTFSLKLSPWQTYTCHFNTWVYIQVLLSDRNVFWNDASKQLQALNHHWPSVCARISTNGKICLKMYLHFRGHVEASPICLSFFFPRAYLVFSAFSFLKSHVISAEPVTLCCSPGPCWAKSITRASLRFPCLPRLPPRKTDGFIVLFYSSLYRVSVSCPTSTTATFTASSCLDMAFLSILHQPDILIMQLWSSQQRWNSGGSERRWPTEGGVLRNCKDFRVWESKKLTASERDISNAGRLRQSDREKRSEFLHCGMTGVLHVSTPTDILHEGDSEWMAASEGQRQSRRLLRETVTSPPSAHSKSLFMADRPQSDGRLLFCLVWYSTSHCWDRRLRVKCTDEGGQPRLGWPEVCLKGGE